MARPVSAPLALGAPYRAEPTYRTESDPHCPEWRWRVVDGVRECRNIGFVTWHRAPENPHWAWSLFKETPERVSLWVELTLVPVEV